MLLGPTGLVLSCTAQNPARLVYGSAALVASLRGQQSPWVLKTLGFALRIGALVLFLSPELVV